MPLPHSQKTRVGGSWRLVTSSKTAHTRSGTLGTKRGAWWSSWSAKKRSQPRLQVAMRRATWSETRASGPSMAMTSSAIDSPGAKETGFGTRVPAQGTGLFTMVGPCAQQRRRASKDVDHARRLSEKASKQESGLDTGSSARYGLGVALSLSSAMEDTAAPDVVTGVLPTRGSGVPS